MKNLITYLKGILLGFVGLAIPGLSASTIAIEVGIYYELIDKISGIIKRFRTCILFVVFIALGYFTGGLIGAFSVKLLYENFPLIAVLLIIGFILGGAPKMAKDLKDGLKKISCYIVFFVIFGLLFLFSFYTHESTQVSLSNISPLELIVLFFVGVVTSTTLIIPGVDFAVLLLAMGYYESLIFTITDLCTFHNVLYNLLVLGTYLLGYGIGSFLLSKVIKKIITKYSVQAKFASFAFVIIAPFVVLKRAVFDNANFMFSYIHLIIGTILGIVAFIVMFFIMRYFDKKESSPIILEENIQKQ